jgi:hypothetical protein
MTLSTTTTSSTFINTAAAIAPKEVFGHLTVLNSLRDTNGLRKYYVRCVCDTRFAVLAEELTSGKTKSCGCKKRENLEKILGKPPKGHRTWTTTAEYCAWSALKNRALNQNDPNWKNYGGRGIGVSPEWANSFAAFFNDMGVRPSADHSLERKDNDRGYCKDNCTWATRKEQAANRRSSVKITLFDVTFIIEEWKTVFGFVKDPHKMPYKVGNKWKVRRKPTTAQTLIEAFGPKIQTAWLRRALHNMTRTIAKLNAQGYDKLDDADPAKQLMWRTTMMKLMLEDYLRERAS